MIDLHSHILPGLDDGPRTLAESVDIARAAVADGTVAMAATPHVRDDYPTTAAQIARAVDAVSAELDRLGIPLLLVPGAEIAVPELTSLADTELAQLGLGGNPQALLVELPYAGWPLGLQQEVERLTAAGTLVVLAHPERSPEVVADARKLKVLIEAGAVAQVTAASLEGRMGSTARRVGRELIDRGLAHLVASDAHGPSVRQVGMRAALKTLDNPALARWLGEDVPVAIVEGWELPPRPSQKRRLRSRFRSTTS